MGIFYVYGHFDKRTGELKYIGKGSTNRAWGFKQRSPLWKSFFSTHYPEVKILHNNLTEKEALDQEVFEIAKARQAGIELLNYGDGGEKGVRYWSGKRRCPTLMKKLTEAGHTEEARKKRRITKQASGWKPSENHRAAVSEKMSGRVLPQEQKDAISKAKKGRPNGLEGRVMPEEHKRKISEARLNSDAVKKSGEKIWETRRARGTATGFTTSKARAVLCVDTGLVYRCAKEAAEAVGGSDKHIQACCAGRRNFHKNLKWRYNA